MENFGIQILEISTRFLKKKKQISFTVFHDLVTKYSYTKDVSAFKTDQQHKYKSISESKGSLFCKVTATFTYETLVFGYRIRKKKKSVL